MRRRTNAAIAKWLEKQEWYEAWLEKSPLKIDKSALSSIDTVKFYAY